MKKIVFIFALVLSVIGLTSCNKSQVANAGEEFKLYTIDQLKAHDGPIKVEFWHSFGHAIQEQLDYLIEDFELEMKEQGINITVKSISTGGGYDGLRKRVNMGTRSNSIPTMILGYPDHFANYIENGILLPLNPFVETTDEEIALPSGGKDDFVQSYWNEVQVKDKKGKDIISGIPFNKSTEVMAYNANFVEPYLVKLGYAAKLGDAWENPTWEQVMKVSEEIKKDLNAAKASNTPLTFKHGDTRSTVPLTAADKYPVIVDSTSNLFITATRQWGGEGKYTRIGANNEGEVVFDNPSVKAALGYFQQNAKAGFWQIPEKLNESYGSNVLRAREAFITIGSTAGIKNNTSDAFDTKVTTYPQKAGSENKAVIQQGTNAAILSKNSNNYTRLAAWLLIRHLTNAENTATFSRKTGYLPVRTSAFESNDYQDFMNTNDPFDLPVARAVTAGYNSRAYSYTDPAFSGSSIVRDEVGNLMVNVFSRESKTIEVAIQDSYRELKSLGLVTKKLDE